MWSWICYGFPRHLDVKADTIFYTHDSHKSDVPLTAS